MPNTPILGRAARLLISPAPATLSDSLCILKRLQIFGPVETFLNPRYVAALAKTPKKEAAQATCLAIFSTPEALKSAVEANTITVETGIDQPDPREEDPYNLRGLRDRTPIPRKTFEFKVVRDTDPDSLHASILAKNPSHGGFEVDTTSPVFTSLTQAGTPFASLATTSNASRLPPQDLAPLFRKEPSSSPRIPALDHIRAQVANHKAGEPSSSVMAIYNNAMQRRAKGVIHDETYYEALSRAERWKKWERNRWHRDRRQHERDRRRQEIEAKQAMMQQELRIQVMQMDEEKRRRDAKRMSPETEQSRIKGPDR